MAWKTPYVPMFPLFTAFLCSMHIAQKLIFYVNKAKKNKKCLWRQNFWALRAQKFAHKPETVRGIPHLLPTWGGCSPLELCSPIRNPVRIRSNPIRSRIRIGFGWNNSNWSRIRISNVRIGSDSDFDIASDPKTENADITSDVSAKSSNLLWINRTF